MTFSDFIIPTSGFSDRTISTAYYIVAFGDSRSTLGGDGGGDGGRIGGSLGYRGGLVVLSFGVLLLTSFPTGSGFLCKPSGGTTSTLGS